MMELDSKVDAAMAIAWAEYQARGQGSGIYQIIPMEVQRAIWNVGFTQGMIALTKVVA